MENDPSKIAESFNSYFSTIAEKLQNKIYPDNANFSKYLTTPLDQKIFFHAADSQEILLIINGFENKGDGPYSIPLEILKIIKPTICHPLKEIINDIWHWNLP